MIVKFGDLEWGVFIQDSIRFVFRKRVSEVNFSYVVLVFVNIFLQNFLVRFYFKVCEVIQDNGDRFFGILEFDQYVLYFRERYFLKVYRGILRILVLQFRNFRVWVNGFRNLILGCWYLKSSRIFRRGGSYQQIVKFFFLRQVLVGVSWCDFVIIQLLFQFI